MKDLKGIEFNFSQRLNCFYHNWHLAFSSKFKDADACLTIGIPFIMISVWANKGWLKWLEKEWAKNE